MSKFSIEPIINETTKERVYRQIKNAVLHGQIPGNEIFTEVQLAEMLNTSRTPVREAILDLSKEGLITTVPRKGLQVRKITHSELEQIFLLRTSIESEIMKALTESITDEQLEVLSEICNLQEEAMNNNENERFINLDQEFHLNLVRFVKFELVEQVLLNLHDLSQLIGLQAIQKQNRMKEVLDEHRNIIRALSDKDKGLAVEVMIDHLNRTKEKITIQED
ncbi:GntR family transcriptional regulator [Ammoniphilus sp. YIM 78166]|uniref:GntR family transcriptional regulator n=1 Tax=Ammoniphilus sp. YIM 78166 TaxID=1644106 RepID=UPI00106FE391|nr:GntR family transcriptional regulator [Ammoniphilus sp. YIM 78166]